MEYPKDYSATPIENFYQEAIDIVRKRKKASAGLLQRCFLIGYDKACDLLDKMENDGVISEFRGNEGRKVFTHVN